MNAAPKLQINLPLPPVCRLAGFASPSREKERVRGKYIKGKG
jgi:hypothetical protein